jgi:hypothetical protein
MVLLDKCLPKLEAHGSEVLIFCEVLILSVTHAPSLVASESIMTMIKI